MDQTSAVVKLRLASSQATLDWFKQLSGSIDRDPSSPYGEKGSYEVRAPLKGVSLLGGILPEISETNQSKPSVAWISIEVSKGRQCDAQWPYALMDAIAGDR
jgi:hypothetical protein